MTYPSPNSMSILLMEEILHQLMSRLSHYVPGFIHPRWFAWLLPSTVVKPTGHPRVCRCPHPGNAGLPRLLTLHQSGACSIWQDGIWELFSSEKQGDCIFLSLHEVSWTSGHGFFPNIIFLATWKQQKKTIKNPGSLFGTWPKKTTTIDNNRQKQRFQLPLQLRLYSQKGMNFTGTQ